MQTLQITVHGKVQGVFFRKSTELEARKLGLTGYVKNQANGTVYIEASGDPNALAEFLNWCHQGPRLARVDRLFYQAVALASHPATFDICYGES